MEVKQADITQLESVKSITKETIQNVYPHYYAQGAVQFFLDHHNDASILDDIKNKRVYLLYLQDMPTGTVTLKNNEINRLFVLPAYQKKGLGRKLMDFSEQKLAQEYDTIRLDASLPAKAIYHKRGYMEIQSHSIYTKNGDVLCYDVMEKTLAHPACAIDYNNRCFMVKNNSANGEVSEKTIFHYHQKGHMIWAEYAGGDIVKGYLIGSCDTSGNLEFSYQHKNQNAQLRMGICRSQPVLLKNGLLELHETWQWLDDEQSYGTSIIMEIQKPSI